MGVEVHGRSCPLLRLADKFWRPTREFHPPTESHVSCDSPLARGYPNDALRGFTPPLDPSPTGGRSRTRRGPSVIHLSTTPANLHMLAKVGKDANEPK